MQEILNSNKNVVLVFSSPTCVPCNSLWRIITRLMIIFPNIEFKKIDTTENSVLSKQFSIIAAPVTVLLIDGKEVGRKIGLMPQGELANWLEDHI